MSAVDVVLEYASIYARFHLETNMCSSSKKKNAKQTS